MKLLFRRAVLKLSGELLGAPSDLTKFMFYAQEIRQAREAGAELGVVMGGGNIARGERLPEIITTGHIIGMLATLINGLVLREALLAQGVPTMLLSAMPCPGVADPVDPWQAKEALSSGQVVLFSGGTGDPFVTTDTAAVIRALSVSAQAVLKGSKVDGIYNTDPASDPSARPISRLTHAEYLARGLRVMDLAAVAIAEESGLPIIVFRADLEGALLSALRGQTGSRIG